MCSSDPPRIALFLSRSARSSCGLSIRQRSTYTCRTSPEISLPIVTPPWPSRISQSRTMMFSRRHVDAPPVGVAPGLDRDAVVAGVEVAAFDQHVAARLRITAVVVRTVRLDPYAAHGDVRAQHRIDLPHRRVPDRHALDQDVAAAVRLDERRPEVGIHAESRVGTGTPRSAMSNSRVRAAALVARRPASIRAAVSPFHGHQYRRDSPVRRACPRR